MAELRKSGKQTAARKLARDRAAAFREKQDTLEQIAAEYFVAAESVDLIEQQAERDIAEIRSRAEAQTAHAREQSDALIRRMLDLNTPRAEVAERLGIEARDVRRAASTPPGEGGAATSSPTDAGSVESAESATVAE